MARMLVILCFFTAWAVFSKFESALTKKFYRPFILEKEIQSILDIIVMQYFE